MGMVERAVPAGLEKHGNPLRILQVRVHGNPADVLEIMVLRHVFRNIRLLRRINPVMDAHGWVGVVRVAVSREITNPAACPSGLRRCNTMGKDGQQGGHLGRSRNIAVVSKCPHRTLRTAVNRKQMFPFLPGLPIQVNDAAAQQSLNHLFPEYIAGPVICSLRPASVLIAPRIHVIDVQRQCIAQPFLCLRHVPVQCKPHQQHVAHCRAPVGIKGAFIQILYMIDIGMPDNFHAFSNHFQHFRPLPRRQQRVKPVICQRGIDGNPSVRLVIDLVGSASFRIPFCKFHQAFHTEPARFFLLIGQIGKAGIHRHVAGKLRQIRRSLERGKHIVGGGNPGIRVLFFRKRHGHKSRQRPPYHRQVIPSFFLYFPAEFLQPCRRGIDSGMPFRNPGQQRVHIRHRKRLRQCMQKEPPGTAPAPGSTFSAAAHRPVIDTRLEGIRKIVIIRMKMIQPVSDIPQSGIPAYNQVISCNPCLVRPGKIRRVLHGYVIVKRPVTHL